ncbi:MAG: hypothetical protein ABFR90_01340 [Planctomycetota bacterium]
MRRRKRKSFILCLLALICAGGLGLYVAGCSDNPEAKAAKEMRSKTTDAVRESVQGKDYESYDAAHNKVMDLLESNRSGGLTGDAALLASGNLALAKGQQMQADLGLKSLPLRENTDALEKTLSSSERLLLEKEKTEKLLTSGDQEVAGLQQLLNGDGQEEGLNKQLERVSAELEKLQSEKKSLQAEKDQAQATLSKYKADADNLMRQAELAQGDQRLDLEKQAFAILQQRKDYYLKAQTAENQIAVIDNDIALVEVRVNGLTGNIKDSQTRIEAINTSQTRAALEEQVCDIQNSIDGNRQRLSELSGMVAAAMAAYRELADQTCAEYDDAIAEFKKVKSSDVDFTKKARLADSAHYAALTCSSFLRTQKYLSERLGMVLETADPVFVSEMQGKLPQQNTDAEYVKKAFAYFDQSVESYEEALSAASRLSRDLKQEDKSKVQDAKCTLMKSQVLALHSKMQLADVLEEFDVANAAETAMGEVIQKGTDELGVPFTQSETMRIIENQDIDYQPSLPLNMEVFIDGKKQELSVWKTLPIDEREAAVDKNVQEIDALTAQYGEDITQPLEVMKQEMIEAKESGFKEPAASSGIGEPNSVY